MNNRKTTRFEQDVFQFLNALRNIGSHNMFTEAPHVIMEHYEISLSEAIQLCKVWRENFNEEGDYDSVNI